MTSVSRDLFLSEGMWVRFLKDPAVQQNEANDRVYFVNKCEKQSDRVCCELIEVHGQKIYDWSYYPEDLKVILSKGRIQELSNEDVVKQFGKEKVDRIYLFAIKTLAGI